MLVLGQLLRQSRKPGATVRTVLKLLVSGCLQGRALRYNATYVPVNSLIWDRWSAEGRLVRFCPEVAVGFPIPRPPAEIVGGLRETFSRVPRGLKKPPAQTSPTCLGSPLDEHWTGR